MYLVPTAAEYVASNAGARHERKWNSRWFPLLWLPTFADILLYFFHLLYYPVAGELILALARDFTCKRPFLIFGRNGVPRRIQPHRHPSYDVFR